MSLEEPASPVTLLVAPPITTTLGGNGSGAPMMSLKGIYCSDAPSLSSEESSSGAILEKYCSGPLVVSLEGKHCTDIPVVLLKFCSVSPMVTLIVPPGGVLSLERME